MAVSESSLSSTSKLQKQFDQGKFVCVGLDSEWARVPKQIIGDARRPAAIAEAVFQFNKGIIDATLDIAGMYKPNSSFYEELGGAGMDALAETRRYIGAVAPEVVTIDDAKRGDIGNTSARYAKAIFEVMGFDAVTLNPYLGRDGVQPFLDYSDKISILLARTSNPGAVDFQNLPQHLTPEQLEALLNGPARQLGSTAGHDRTMPLYKHIASTIANHWDVENNCALVVGATYPKEAAEIRAVVGDIPFLVPGVGAQGGDLEAAVMNSKNSRNQGIIVNSSRGIIFASAGEDFAEAARRETLKLHNGIREVLGIR